MNYKALTVFNFKISYYAFRIFTLFWIAQQYSFFVRFLQRPKELYEPSVWLQKIFMPVFPSSALYLTIMVVTACLLVYSLFRFSVWINLLLFFLTAYLSLAITGYVGLGHNNHVLVLSYFLSVFLNPKKMNADNYRAVEIYYFGILITYSLAGFWKLVSMLKDVYTGNPEISWYETDAAKYNTMLNFFMIDQKVPQWIMTLYEYKELWVVITIAAIICQALCFLGAFNRKILTCVLVFLLIFHFYTVYFVVADWRIMKYGLIVLFFPYHHFSSWIRRYFNIN